MIEQDSIKLLRECDAGVKMGVSAIGEVLPYVKAEPLRELLRRGRDEHERLAAELETLLARCCDEGKDPNPVAKGMSFLKTSINLALDASDATVADLMVDGCNMGVKSLSKYLNEYKGAEGNAKALAGRLIALEEGLARELRPYL